LIRRMGLRDLRNKPYSKPKRLLLSSPLVEPNVYGPLDPVNKYIPSLIADGGFRIEQMQTANLVKFPKAWTNCWWGTAIPK
jgi:hypothetical protein